MSIFDRIKGAIWGKKDGASHQASATPTATLQPTTPITASAASAGGSASASPTPIPKTTAAPQPTSSPTAGSAAPAAPTQTSPSHAASASTPVDVEAILDAAVKANGQKLDWRHSIVDTMKALGMESSLSERKELADELGYTGDKGDSAKMNIWLQKALMKKLAENGGKVPANLLD